MYFSDYRPKLLCNRPKHQKRMVIKMINERRCALGLDALLEQDSSSFEFYNALSDEYKRKIKAQDVRSFEEMQSYVSQLRNNK